MVPQEDKAIHTRNELDRIEEDERNREKNLEKLKCDEAELKLKIAEMMSDEVVRQQLVRMRDWFSPDSLISLPLLLLLLLLGHRPSCVSSTRSVVASLRRCSNVCRHSTTRLATSSDWSLSARRSRKSGGPCHYLTAHLSPLVLQNRGYAERLSSEAAGAYRNRFWSYQKGP